MQSPWCAKTLGLRYKKCCLFEVATTGTVSVINRRGQRLGTVYLAYVPELGQQTMSAALTRLVREVLHRWEGPLPAMPATVKPAITGKNWPR